MRPRLRFGDFFSASFRSARISDGEWEEAAAALGLSLDRTLAGADAVFGTRGDIDVAIGRMTYGDRLVTRYRMQFAALPFGFQMLGIGHDDVFEVRQALEHRQTGHDSLDARVITRTDDPDLLAEWLSPARVRLIVDLFNAYRPLEVSSVAVTYHSQLPDPIETIVRVGRDLVSSAATMLNIAPRVAELSRPDQATPTAVQPRGVFADPLPATEQPPDSLSSPDRAAAAAEDTPAVDDDETAPEPADVSGDVLGRIVATMFGAERLSFETDQALQAFSGTEVTWPATVRSARPFTADSELGAGPGTKVQATVATHDDPLLGPTRIDAVVGLPPGEGADLERGDTVTIAGTIGRIDSMMRTIYVTNGRIAT